jgi:hypothetical protein
MCPGGSGPRRSTVPTRPSDVQCSIAPGGTLAHEYAVADSRQVSDSGHVIGAFTDASDPENVRVYFFRARVRRPEDPVVCL